MWMRQIAPLPLTVEALVKPAMDTSRQMHGPI
jgi:hypothetical protein